MMLTAALQVQRLPEALPNIREFSALNQDLSWVWKSAENTLPWEISSSS